MVFEPIIREVDLKKTDNGIPSDYRGLKGLLNKDVSELNKMFTKSKGDFYVAELGGAIIGTTYLIDGLITIVLADGFEDSKAGSLLEERIRGYE